MVTIIVAGMGLLPIGELLSFARLFARNTLAVEPVLTATPLNIALLAILVLFWSFLIVTLLSFWRRHAWSRRVVVVLVGLCMIGAVWWGFTLLIVGVFGGGHPASAWGSPFLFRVLILALGVGALALTGLCFSLIQRLRSPGIASLFSSAARANEA